MAIEKDKVTRDKFIKKFERGYKTHDFYNFVPFVDTEAGFSLKKKRKGDTNVTLIQVALLSEGSLSRRKVFAGATYGEESGTAVSIRPYEEVKLSDPVDIEFRDDFYFDVNNGVLYDHDKKITPTGLLNEVYGKHIKSTKMFRGFYLRLKLWFWKKLIKGFLDTSSAILSALLYIASGTRYSYDPFWDDEVAPDKLNVPSEGTELSVKEGKKITFLDFNASSWSIFVYCLLHLLLYVIFSAINYKPQIITTLLQNNFLTLAYVVISISLIETTIPAIFKRLIKFLSNLSFQMQLKNIRV